MKKFIEMLKRRKAQKLLKEQQKQESFLTEYFSFIYWVNDMGRLEIPYFQKAEQTVNNLKKKGLLKDVYNYIIERGVKVA